MITLHPLPYDLNSLTPFISERTLRFHYEKHHAGYVNTTNTLIKETELNDKTLEQIILTAASDTVYTKLFNNAAQVWNHDFYWNSLTPDPQKQQIPFELLEKINKDFGSLAEFKDTLINMGLNHFGSGWVWLVKENDSLKVITTSNAECPLTKANMKPLLVLDLWEHAYYLDYQNLRKDYLINTVQNLLNWDFAYQNMD